MSKEPVARVTTEHMYRLVRELRLEEGDVFIVIGRDSRYGKVVPPTTRTEVVARVDHNQDLVDTIHENPRSRTFPTRTVHRRRYFGKGAYHLDLAGEDRGTKEDHKLLNK